MSNNVSWIFELSLTSGTPTELNAYMQELADSAFENEAGTLIYEWSLNEQQNICHIFERYSDSKSALTHLKTFNEKYAAKLMSYGTATNFIVYGKPTDELMVALTSFGGQYMTTMGGFARS